MLVESDPPVFLFPCISLHILFPTGTGNRVPCDSEKESMSVCYVCVFSEAAAAEMPERIECREGGHITSDTQRERDMNIVRDTHHTHESECTCVR